MTNYRLRWDSLILLILCLFSSRIYSLRYDPREVDYNLNANKNAVEILDYSSDYTNHQYFPSPKHWRLIFYTIILDRWFDGDPSNNDANNTVHEFDPLEPSLRHGGDVYGLEQSLDYLQGMGVQAVYIAGTPFLNEPWGGDGFSPIDYTVLDHHSGTVQEWRSCINAMHDRQMYLIVDMTVGTLANRIGFKGYMNTTAEFTLQEHQLAWRHKEQVYPDFQFNNEYTENCTLPEFWGDDGSPVIIDWTGCYDSDFDQYGDTEAFGVFPPWRRALSKFQSVQDRLRDWRPSLKPKLIHLACLVIEALDVDGFRIDKATQMTVDFMAEFSDGVHKCAKKYNKDNFFLPGEVTGSSSFGSIFYGRGRQPNQRPYSYIDAFKSNGKEPYYYLRQNLETGMDASAFHYSVYRAISRHMGLDGLIEISYDVPQEFTDIWKVIATNEDNYNPLIGKHDPRHLYGTTNHDVFRWPSITNGTYKLILGTMISQFLFPGSFLIYYGDEQNMYVLDNEAYNYLFGRQQMASAYAWKLHGCYGLGSQQYHYMPLDPARKGCYDDWNTLDHFDPSNPLRNVHKSLHSVREDYLAILHGWDSNQLGNWTVNTEQRVNKQYPWVHGVFSIQRGQLEGLQDISEYSTGSRSKTTDVWILYSNDPEEITINESCNSDSRIAAPFKSGTVVKNILYPYDTFTLTDGQGNLKNGDKEGCVSSLTFPAYGFKIYVPEEDWLARPPMITKFTPGHDHRFFVPESGTQDIEFEFSEEMDCDSITSSITVESKTADNSRANVEFGSCQNFSPEAILYSGQLPGVFKWSGKLKNIKEGVYKISLKNIPTKDKSLTTQANDHYLLRFGSPLNPIVHFSANRSETLLIKKGNDYYLNHTAVGADKFRYTMDWASHWSDWIDYNNEMTKVNWTLRSSWKGSKKQAWKGEYVQIQYWSALTGSAHYVQYGSHGGDDRMFPHVFMMGSYNQFGYDAGLQSEMKYEGNGNWSVPFTASIFPSKIQFNIWGMNPDGQPDEGFIYGDVMNHTTLSRLSPSNLEENAVNVTYPPQSPYLSYKVYINDRLRTYYFVPKGNQNISLIIFILMAIIPPITAMIAVSIFKSSFYQIKFNKDGKPSPNFEKNFFFSLKPIMKNHRFSNSYVALDEKSDFLHSGSLDSTATPLANGKRRKCVLIATLEYDIPDWNIRIKIGGLGVMAQLMGQHFKHQDLVWVVPCVGDIEYPEAPPAQPIEVKVIDQTYTINVMHHYLDNIKYVLLDAPVFRRQTSMEPYPARMDDLSSAIFYSAWNQCIAEVIRRNPVDIYHINDYHGALAPLYLLPNVIPCALSLHNAEFQGLWPLRTHAEKEEVCAVYNISPRVCSKYIQFGNVFNLLHAGVSYLRIHQKGFGAVGVSHKYGKRSWARYPIFWGLKKIGNLPNPDPTDTGDYNDNEGEHQKIMNADPALELTRADHKQEAQAWAGLNIDPKAQLMVFVGRWSMQKGIDLIADLAPTLLNEYNVQLIAVGPVIDLYGKFAAEKLNRLMEMYPGRVYSRPEFTQLPPSIFLGADFALIPSRDEPFGLVAVEFGRKGVLGIGARVGGLGQMPGWWYTVESNATSHLLRQFESACRQAISSSDKTRAMLRAKASQQRFPVVEWQRRLDALQDTCIKLSSICKKKKESSRNSIYSMLPDQLSKSSVALPNIGKVYDLNNNSTPAIEIDDTTSSNEADGNIVLANQLNTKGQKLKRQLSLGSRRGPGHINSQNNSEKSDPNNLRVIDEEDSEKYYDPEAVRARISNSQGESFSDYQEESGDEDFDPQQATMYDFFVDDDAALRKSPGLRPQFGRINDLSGLSASMSQDDLSLPYPKFPDANSSYRNPYASPHSPQSPPLPGQQSFGTAFRNESRLSLASVMTSSQNKEFALTKLDAKFTDADDQAIRKFSILLRDLNPKNSKDQLCIEYFLEKSEKEFFDVLRKEQLGLSKPNKSLLTGQDYMVTSSPVSDSLSSFDHCDRSRRSINDFSNEFHYEHPKVRGLKRIMQRRIGDWPLYTFFLALGQILAATSFQLTLLSGTTSQTGGQLYIIAAFFLVGTIYWWILYRRVASFILLSQPFIFYATAFFIIGLTGVAGFKSGARKWVELAGTWIYAFSSGSGSLYFALNFGDEGSSGIQAWVFRACVVQGLQQLWAAGLWYWGSHIDAQVIPLQHKNPKLSIAAGAVLWVVAILLGCVSIILRKGLPEYYRQMPSKIPAFYKSLIRRKLVLWFIIATILSNFWLATLYGRSWKYLWSSDVKAWAIFLLLLLFYVVIWIVALIFMSKLSKTHPWFIPVFGAGLIAPRWAQEMWGTSLIGLYLPWGGQAGPYLGRCLWLWLGLLDSLQGIGIGMMLLQTLTRAHVATTLMAGQLIGTLATMLARWVAPNRVGPSNVFIDLTGWVPRDGIGPFASGPFWICLICQVAICLGYFLFFRKEQLAKP